MHAIRRAAEIMSEANVRYGHGLYGSLAAAFDTIVRRFERLEGPNGFVTADRLSQDVERIMAEIDDMRTAVNDVIADFRDALDVQARAIKALTEASVGPVVDRGELQRLTSALHDTHAPLRASIDALNTALVPPPAPVEPEPVLEAAPEPMAAPEPVLETAPEPVAAPEPVLEAAPALEAAPEPMAAPEQALEPLAAPEQAPEVPIAPV